MVLVLEGTLHTFLVFLQPQTLVVEVVVLLEEAVELVVMVDQV